MVFTPERYFLIQFKISGQLPHSFRTGALLVWYPFCTTNWKWCCRSAHLHQIRGALQFQYPLCTSNVRKCRSVAKIDRGCALNLGAPKGHIYKRGLIGVQWSQMKCAPPINQGLQQKTKQKIIHGRLAGYALTPPNPFRLNHEHSLGIPLPSVPDTFMATTKSLRSNFT